MKVAVAKVEKHRPGLQSKHLAYLYLMKKLPFSIQTFEHLRNHDLIYVDKTEFLYKLVSEGKYYFFSRPRRFGKSLLLTTLKSYFKGDKHLFEGLYIAENETKWKSHPVVHIDYSLVSYFDGLAVFKESLVSYFKTIAEPYDIELTEKNPTQALSELVIKLYKKYGSVVVLVDEYDKPLVDTLTKKEKFEENKILLRNLYGALKGLDAYFRFVMLTGVSRFGKVNVFSGMNNLNDISEDPEFSTAVGFTQEELEENFSEHLSTLAAAFDTSVEILMPQIKYMYNGFSFDGITTLYNPFSVIKLFFSKEFGNYWFSSGTPTFLIDLIKKQKELPEKFEGIIVSDLTGGTDRIENFPLYPLLYQTGYLTIRSVEYDNYRRQYTLDYPNAEVRESFIRYVLAAFVDKQEFDIQPEGLKLRNTLRHEKTDEFIKLLQSFFADIPYQLHIPAEAYYHSLAYMLLRLVGIQIILEKSTDKGRIDAVLDLTDKIYIIEFKFATDESTGSPETLAVKALEQIEKKKYYESYMGGDVKVILFGIGFSDKKIAGKVRYL